MSYMGLYAYVIYKIEDIYIETLKFTTVLEGSDPFFVNKADITWEQVTMRSTRRPRAISKRSQQLLAYTVVE